MAEESIRTMTSPAGEAVAAEIRKRHKLTSFHIFDQDNAWRVFAFRKDPKGYQASVESGTGPNIVAALNDLDARLVEGPIHKSPTPPPE